MRCVLLATMVLALIFHKIAAQEFSDATQIHFEPHGTRVKASFRLLSSDCGALLWQSVPYSAYIIEEGDLVDDWLTYAVVVGGSGEETLALVPIRAKAQFFRVEFGPGIPHSRLCRH
jgi:hypothetical protein